MTKISSYIHVYTNPYINTHKYVYMDTDINIYTNTLIYIWIHDTYIVTYIMVILYMRRKMFPLETWEPTVRRIPCLQYMSQNTKRLPLEREFWSQFYRIDNWGYFLGSVWLEGGKVER